MIFHLIFFIGKLNYFVLQPPQTTSEPGETTTEAYKISRAEFGEIVNRNFRGLQKLARIEIADARNVRNILKFFEL